MSAMAKNRIKSSWTPLTNDEQNNKLFEERRTLIGKWFDKWSDNQRKQIIEDLILRCKVKQLEFAAEILKTKVPVHRDDFTRELPRVITLYILSFLDPRSLCRCAQVCWNWKHLSEADQIWMPKSIRLGWYLTFDPSPHEIGIWKRNYIENVNLLNFLAPKGIQSSPVPLQERLDRLSIKVAKEKKEKAKTMSPAPWKGSDKVPTDTWRYNYLKNDDEIEKVKKLRKKGFYGQDAVKIESSAKFKIKSGASLSSANKNKPRTIPKVSYNTEELDTEGRPQWAKFQSGAPFVNKSELGESKTMDASDRPGPVHRIRVPPQRSDRDPPSSNLFPHGQAWTQPAHDSDEE
ncbi:F-box only protein 16-like isoform X2 [Lineus longissimus]|uniref:F-box only protein 16-like isoform X2 n=1 Tax=Lineus longissimus TaxID=88925 RepID=UPI002B4D5A06